MAALLVTGPVMALVNQGAMYSVTMWACGHDSPGAVHIVPVCTLLVVIVASIVAFRVGSGGGTPRQSSHWLSVAAATIGLFSAAVIVAQWVAAMTFPPCLQS